MTGEYIETTLVINPYSEDVADVMAALLAAEGYETFIPTEDGIKCYVLKEVYSEQAVKRCNRTKPIRLHNYLHKRSGRR